MIALILALLVPQEFAQRLRAGQEKIKVRDFDGAIPEFERCLQLQPDEYNASFGLGICFWEKEDFRKARDHFTKVVELVEKSQPGAPLPGVHQKLLGCAMLLEDFDTAIAEATKLIRLQATGEYYFARALARQRSGDEKGALDDCAAALKEDAVLIKARGLRAELLLGQGEEKAALDELAEAVKLRPADPGPYLARAAVHYRRQRWAEARTDLRTGFKLNQGQHSNLETQGWGCALMWAAATRCGAADDLVALFKKNLKDMKKNPAANHLVALPLYLAGELSEPGLLAAAAAAPGRKSQAAAEVWFFIGERRLLAGDQAGAREAFGKCVQAGARGTFEHDLAVERLSQNR